ncbi:MAG: ABC transporter ATP-binding protein [Prevotella sp.]|uniref:ABC transporter ATP-binding protein n=1 Tax=Prevotella sp. AGR2160 TaxID=1280674 RepID=UPI0004146DB9|nr:ABC transporter ATP-binding protein [Prevotella sp. AGR2160]MDD5862009.1 ABC transporter ATP-binding protein [Prevotella sp.]
MIEIKNLTYRYPGAKHPVFEDFSLTLEGNRIYGLLGKNGTGKSTLLYLISGLLRPTAGEVLLGGRRSFDRTPEMLEDLFLVPEEYDLPAMGLREYVKVNRMFYPRFSEEILTNCLRDFEIAPDVDLKALSMGQKKKVYMSFALATGTRLILMDEPTNGLDIPSKSLFRKVVARYMTEDRTMIISTHQVHDIESLLDHIVIIDQSEVLLNSSVSDLTARYAFRAISEQEAEGPDVVYTEPSIMGLAAILRRQPGEEETQVNLELLFDAITKSKKVKK